MRFTDIYMLVCEDKLSDELAKSSLTDEQKDKVRAINSKLSNKTKYIGWLIKNIDDLSDDTEELLNWFQSRNDLNDKDIAHYDMAKLQALHGERSNTKSQDRKAVKATTDEEGAKVIYKKGAITVWRALKAKWLRKNFANTNWCVAASDYQKHFDKYTIGNRLKLYVIHDDSRQRYEHYTEDGDVFSDICIGVKPNGIMGDGTRQAADNTSIEVEVIYSLLQEHGIKPSKLGLPDTIPPHLTFWGKILDDAGGVEIVDGKRVVEGDIYIPEDARVASLKDMGVDLLYGDFTCSYCKNITSLEGGPVYVGGDFNCSGCSGLTSLEHCPKTILASLDCSGCTGFTSSLEGHPEFIGGSFLCNGCTSLTSLEGCPTSVAYGFHCDRCGNLSTLEHCPTRVGGDFDCRSCGIKFTEAEVRSRCEVEGNIHI